MRIILCSLFLLAFFSVLHETPACAATVPATCDSDFYDIMSNRAWMEGKREMEVAQNLILKPDSVLEYSCFNVQLNRGATDGSYTTIGFGLDRLVRPPLLEHVDNFYHTLAGGKGGSVGATCDAMFVVWDFVKCMTVDKQDFRAFQNYINTDYRWAPAQCNEAGRSTKWQNAINVTNPPPAQPVAAGGLYEVDTFLGLIHPGYANCSNIDPIPTGLTVRRWNNNGTATVTFDDAVCPMVGCYYDGSACN